MARQLRPISSVRRDLVAARIALRNASDELASARAAAEQRAIDAAVAAARAGANGKEVDPEKALGGNERARERALTLALADDRDYQAVRLRVRALEEAVDLLEAELEDARDVRREREWEIRARLADALDNRGVQSDHAEASPEDDVAFDDAADEAVVEEAGELVRAILQSEEPDYWPGDDELEPEEIPF